MISKIKLLLKKNETATKLAKFILLSYEAIKSCFFEMKVKYTTLRHSTLSHNLENDLVISLTSYPPRFNKLHLTLKCLLNQTIKPNKIILWVTPNDYEKLPPKVIELLTKGITIKTCEELYSYKKIIPTLTMYPDSFIVTADDDLYYPSNWLEELVTEYKKNPGMIICHRAHKITLNQRRLPKKYLDWELEIKDSLTSPLLLPTTGAGAIYHPSSFYKDVCKKHIFLKLCPTSDDIWLFWMLRLNNMQVRTIGTKPLITWNGSQKVTLLQKNIGPDANNDLAIKKMIQYYSFPYLPEG